VGSCNVTDNFGWSNACARSFNNDNKFNNNKKMKCTKEQLIEGLEKNNYNVLNTANYLNVSESYIRSIVDKYKIDKTKITKRKGGVKGYTAEYIIPILEKHKYVVHEAAKEIGMHHSNLWRCMRRLGIEEMGVATKGARKTEFREDAKILIFDIETSPMIVYSWGLWEQDIPIGAIIQDWYVLCWSAKWLGSDNVMSDALSNYKEYKGGKNNDVEFKVIASIWELLNEADVAVAHNGKAFDKKKLNTKFFEYGFTEPNYKMVDTMLIAKANFALSSNKLDYIAKFTGGEGKIATSFDLWKGCMNGDKKSWVDMVTYCKRDVKELERVYLTLRGWDKYAPNYNMYTNTTIGCNVCGSTNLVYDKNYSTQSRTYELFKCSECGHCQRNTTPVDKKEVMLNV